MSPVSRVLDRINRIITNTYTGIFQNIVEHMTIDCKACRANFFFTDVLDRDEIGICPNEDVDPNIMTFEFRCPRCRELVVIGLNSIRISADAVPKNPSTEIKPTRRRSRK